MSVFDFIYQKLFKNKIDYYKQEVIKNHLVIRHGYQQPSNGSLIFELDNERLDSFEKRLKWENLR